MTKNHPGQIRFICPQSIIVGWPSPHCRHILVDPGASRDRPPHCWAGPRDHPSHCPPANRGARPHATVQPELGNGPETEGGKSAAAKAPVVLPPPPMLLLSAPKKTQVSCSWMF